MSALEGRALVTGATSGLGRAMAEALLEAGMEVVVAARDSQRLYEVAAYWQALGLPAHAAAVDVRDPQSVANLADWTQITSVAWIFW